MPQTNQLAHRNVTQTSLPYKSNISPTDTTPCLVPGSTDILTSIIGYAERRPGFSLNVEPTPTTFNNLQRFFTWDRFDGTFIEMACDVNASNQAVVYKRVIGADKSFVLIFTDTGSAALFDFVTSNNQVYFSNGNTAKKWDPTNGLSNWGIAIGSTTGTQKIAGNGADEGSSWNNPNNVTSISSYATTSATGFDNAVKFSSRLDATQFGFSISSSSTILGIQVTFDSIITNNGAFALQLLKNGVGVGTLRFFSGSGISQSTGGSADLWGTTWTYNDINQTNFGIGIQGEGPIGATSNYSIRNVLITIFSTGGPSIVVSGSAGTMSAVSGYEYVYCYGNSNTGQISSPTPVSASTGAFGGKISTTTIAAGGSGYAANDTGIVSAGGFNATYTVNSVTGGAVTTYTISTAGSSYIVANNIPTARGGTQPGSGTGFTINITAISGVANVQVSLVASTDAQVNQIRVFRTTDSAPTGIVAGTFLEIPTSPYTNTTANITDSAPDTSLNINSIAPFPGFNDPPTPGQQPVYFAGRIWLFKNNKVVFSGLEETINGVPEESFPSGTAGNFWNFDQPVQGLAVAGTGLSQTLLIYCGGRLYGITGSSLDTFQRFLISNRRGCRNLNTVTSLGGMVAWLDSASQIWATDGQSLQELSLDIRPDISGGSPVGANFTFHVAGKYHWLVCAFPSNIFVYDMDLQQWMPPWSTLTKAMYSGETSAGVYNLMASTGTKAIILNSISAAGNYNDNGVTYQPVIKTQNFAMVPDFGRRFSYAALGLYDEPSRTGMGWYFQADSNASGTFSDVAILVDDDPTNTSSTYISIAANLVGPDVAWVRKQGINLIQNIFSMNGPVGRWLAIKMTLQKADRIDKIFQWFLAYSERK